MSGIKFKGISGYDFLLKKYAAGLITVSVSRNHPELATGLENVLDVKSVVKIDAGQTSWNPTAVRGIKDTGGYAYVVRVKGEGEAIVSYTDENGDAASAVVKTGNAFVCISGGQTWAEAKWLFVSDDEVVVTVENKAATFGWGQNVTVATIQGKNITLTAPADPAVGDVAQVTYDSNNVLQPISGSTKKYLKLPKMYVKAVNDAETGDNRGIYVRYWDAAGVEQSHPIATVVDLDAIFDISDLKEDVATLIAQLSNLDNELLPVIAESLVYLYNKNKALREMLTGKDNAILPYIKAQTVECEDMRTMGVPHVLTSAVAGAPSAANVPGNWDEATMGVWDGCPRKVGQQYADQASRKVYYAPVVTGSTSDWVALN